MNPDPALKSCIDSAKIFYNLIILSQLEFQARISPEILPRVLSSRSQSSVFYFYYLITLKTITSHLSDEILNDQNWQKLKLFLTCLEIQYPFSSVLPPLFSLRHVNRKLFTWNRLFIPKNYEIGFLRRTWSPDWPNVAKFLLVLNYLDIPSRLWRKQHFWIHLSRS